MRSRQLWLLNAALAAIAVLMGLRVASDWRRGNERYARLEAQSAGRATAAILPQPVRFQPASPEVVSQNLFMPDRSSSQPQSAATQAPAGLPVVIGTMQLGAGYEALMAEAGQTEAGKFRRVKSGQQIGGYTVVEIQDDAVVVEYQGLRTTVNVYQSARSVMRAAAAAAATAPPAAASATPPAAAPVVVNAPNTASSPAATDRPAALSPDAASAAGFQPSPYPGVRMRIEGNRRRFERDTMFGPQVWYEDIK